MVLKKITIHSGAALAIVFFSINVNLHAQGQYAGSSFNPNDYFILASTGWISPLYYGYNYSNFYDVSGKKSNLLEINQTPPVSIKRVLPACDVEVNCNGHIILDSKVGRLLARLEQMAVTENTLVKYTTENESMLDWYSDGRTTLSGAKKLLQGLTAHADRCWRDGLQKQAPKRKAFPYNQNKPSHSFSTI